MKDDSPWSLMEASGWVVVPFTEVGCRESSLGGDDQFILEHIEFERLVGHSGGDGQGTTGYLGLALQ